jgi:acetyl-CoA/propionyl-CoA carboxylase biotin carboxyl carrier protein
VTYFESVLVANRGEISRRVTRTLARLGIRSIAIYTDVDAGAPHTREADEAVRVASYLEIDAVIEAAKGAGAAAVHPGYGFLSENAAFAKACADADIVFIGPSPEAIELMGDKVRAKAAAEEAGVPVVPSYTADEARKSDDYPLLVKAAAGGGGRGMRVVEKPEDLDAAVESAQREAKAGFGDDRVFIEKFVPRARHIEVQVIGDIALGERECSLQRRHQKLVEEAPSAAVSPELREQLCAEASALAKAAGYENAGTVEFIADADDPSVHFFLEMNARLQVEHPVTEMVTGLDLVELQLRAAAGAALGISQTPTLQGHAIEVRVNAEDRAFLPSTGTVLEYRRPPGVRVDDAIETGSVVGTDYDSLLAKIIVHGDDRDAAVAKLDRALSQTAILGVTTNVGVLRSLLALDDVRTNAVDTTLVERVDLPDPPHDNEAVMRAAALAQRGPGGGWRLGGPPAPSWWLFSVEGEEPEEIVLEASADADPRWIVAHQGEDLWVARDGYTWKVHSPSVEEAHAVAADGDLTAPMPGSVLKVNFKEGDEVKEGDAIVVVESMKMEMTLSAPGDGVVSAVLVKEGERVNKDQHLASVELSEDD